MAGKTGTTLLAQPFYWGAVFVAWGAYRNGLPELLVYTLLLALAGGLIDWLNNKGVQSRRNREAAEIIGQIMQGRPTRRFFLYLRPFVTDKKLTSVNEAQVRGRAALFDPAAFERESVTLEESLANAFASRRPVVSIGANSGDLGPGKVASTDQDWQSLALRLLEASEAIFMVPGYQEGTLWEIRTIKDRQLLEKTVFMVPPPTKDFGVQAHVKETAEAMRALGLASLDETSVVYTLKSTGALHRSMRARFSPRASGNLKRAIRWVLRP